MRKSNYNFEVIEDVLCIEDIGPHDQFLTVTNNAEVVMDEMKDLYKDKMPTIVIYRDSEGIWDGMEYDGGRLEFYHIQLDNIEDAIRAAKERRNSL